MQKLPKRRKTTQKKMLKYQIDENLPPKNAKLPKRNRLQGDAKQLQRCQMTKATKNMSL